jgi:hypothetical protein
MHVLFLFEIPIENIPRLMFPLNGEKVNRTRGMCQTFTVILRLTEMGVGIVSHNIWVGDTTIFKTLRYRCNYIEIVENFKCLFSF